MRGQTSLGITVGWPSPSRPARVGCHRHAALAPFSTCRPEGGDSIRHSPSPGTGSCPYSAFRPAQPTPHKVAPTDLPPDSTVCLSCPVSHLHPESYRASASSPRISPNIIKDWQTGKGWDRILPTDETNGGPWGEVINPSSASHTEAHPDLLASPSFGLWLCELGTLCKFF